MWILPSRSGIQVRTQDVSPQYPRIFQTDLGSLDLSYRENMVGGTDWNVCLLFPESVGAFPKVTKSGEIVTEKWPSSKHFQAMCYFQDSECWENYVPSVNERHQKRMGFQASIRNCQDSQMLELQVCTEDLISRSVQYVSLHFHSFLNTFLAQNGTVHE